MAAQVVVLKKLLQRAGSSRIDGEEQRPDCPSTATEIGTPTPHEAWPSFNNRVAESLEDGSLQEDTEVVNHVYATVQTHRERKGHYCNLFVFLAFYILYLTVLFLQQQSPEMFKVTVGHNILLPRDVLSNPQTELDDIPAVYDYLNTSILGTIFKPPVCGDGHCDSPEEIPGFGRFGCAPDCGAASTTNIQVHIRTDFERPEELAQASWNLCMKEPARLCWYHQDQRFAAQKSELVEVFPIPDGVWELELHAPNGGLSGSIMTSAGIAGNMRSQSEYATVATFGGCEDPAKSALVACKNTCGQVARCVYDGCADLAMADVSGLYVACVSLCNTDKTVMDIFHNTSCIQKLLGDREAYLPSVPVSFNSSCLLDPSYLGTFPGASALAAQLNLPVAPLGIPRSSSPLLSPAPVNAPDATVNTSTLNESSAAVSGKYWARLGPTDASRLNNLRFAVSRTLNTIAGDSCLAGYNQMNLTRMASRLAPFLCAYLGGPADLPGCSYTNPATNQTLTSADPTALKAALGARYGPGTGLNISQAEVDCFLDLLLGALLSTTGVSLSDEVLHDMYLRLRDLAPQVVTNPVYNNCHQVELIESWETDAHVVTRVALGRSVTWLWADDEPHALVGGDEATKAQLRGFGTGTAALSRLAKCTHSNLGPTEEWLRPIPCVLEPASQRYSPVDVFSYSHVFDRLGVFNFSDARLGAAITASVTVVSDETGPSTGSAELFCAPGCSISMLLSGRCERACDNAACAFDGGDCDCADPTAIDGWSRTSDAKQAACHCPAGQTHDPDSISTAACCEVADVDRVLFSINATGHYGDVAQILATHPRHRQVARTNNVVGGILLHQVRTEPTRCRDAKFFALNEHCFSSAKSTAPFGVDPVFLPTSSLYNIDLHPSDFYAASEIDAGEGVPYGFHSLPAPGLDDGYPIVFDINLDEMGVQERLAYLMEGLYLDNSTSSLLIKIVTFNGETAAFTDFSVHLTFQTGGNLVVTSDVQVVDVQLYASPEDWARLALEILLVIGVLFNVFTEVKEMRRVGRREGNIWRYFAQPWNFVDVLSVILMLVTVVLWVVYVAVHAEPFDTAIRYDIYDNLRASANFFKLASNGSEFRSLMNVFHHLQRLVTFKAIYLTLNGINIFLMTLRVFKLLDFQPQLGIFTRALALAAPELGNFTALWALVFFAYVCMGCLMFGHILPEFQDLGASAFTCFTMILGSTDIGSKLYSLPHAVDRFTGQLFYWSYQVFMVFIIMNFLIAIVVDAFVEVQGQIDSTASVPEELFGFAKGYVGRVHRSFLPDQQVARTLRRMGAVQGGSAPSRGPRARLKRSDTISAEDEAVTRKLVLKVGQKQVDFETLEGILSRNSSNGSLFGADRETAVKSMARQIMLQYGQHVEVQHGRREQRKPKRPKKGPKLEDEMRALKGQVARLTELFERALPASDDLPQDSSQTRRTNNALFSE